MTLVLELPEELQRRLRAISEDRHEAQEAVAVKAINEGLESLQASVPKHRTGAEVVASWRTSGAIGAWNDRSDIGDAVEFARELRRRSNERINE
ncbi:MAG TPA: hypothetical protein VGM51_10190 [Armatimonadota bacterium]|jgi:predicted transcriptional regulator